jgi:hypothetical protein
MLYNKYELYYRVIAEAESIRQYATFQERGRLDFETFNPSERSYCIYGQMTGHCDSERGKELIRLCAIRPFSARLPDYSPPDFPVYQPDNMTSAWVREYTALEFYVVLASREQCRLLLQYLIGQRDSLAVEDLELTELQLKNKTYRWYE